MELQISQPSLGWDTFQVWDLRRELNLSVGGYKEDFEFFNAISMFFSLEAEKTLRDGQGEVVQGRILAASLFGGATL